MAVFVASFIYVIPGVVYGAAALLGFGSTLLWVAQAAALTSSSSDENRNARAGVFWGIYQIGMLLGNTTVLILMHLFSAGVMLMTFVRVSM